MAFVATKNDKTVELLWSARTCVVAEHASYCTVSREQPRLVVIAVAVAKDRGRVWPRRSRLTSKQRRLQFVQVRAHVADRRVRKLHVYPQPLRLLVLLARLADAAHVSDCEHHAAALVRAHAVAVRLRVARVVTRARQAASGVQARTWSRCRSPFSRRVK